jgi:hypothetical protein
VDAAYRRLEALIFNGARMSAVRSELELRPPEERADLCRYAWGLLDQRYGPDEEAGLWLYAWALARKARNGHQPRPGARIQSNPR